MEKDMKRARAIIDAMARWPEIQCEAGRPRFSFADFYTHDPDELRSAFEERISDAPSHFSHFFEFNDQVANQHWAFAHSRLVWDRIGLPTQPTLVNVLFDRTRHADNQLQVGTYTLEQLKQHIDDDPSAHEWFHEQVQFLSSKEQPCVFVLYTDDERGEQHNLTFGYRLELPVPKYMDGSGTADLLMKCLREGYNILDTYQLIKMDHHHLYSVIRKMDESGHFNHKQIQYLTSFPLIINTFTELLDNDEFENGYKADDSQRYTEVVFELTDSINFTLRSFTPSGVVQLHDSVPVDFRFLDGLAEQCFETMKDGDHLVRFYNKTYMIQHNEPMWIPFYLRGGEVSPPIEASEYE